MTLEAVVQDKTGIPSGLEAHYVEVDGKFVLDVPGMKTQSDFDNYASALKKRYADAGADFARQQGAHMSRDEILDAVTSAISKANPGGEKPAGGKGNGEGNGEVAQRLHDLERNVASQAEEITTLTKQRDDALNKSRSTTIRNSLTEAAAGAGVDPAGVQNLVTLVESDFEIAQDGTVVTRLEAKNGVSPNIAPKDYLATISREPAFRMYWPPSKGAGADHGGLGGGGGSTDTGAGNPWSKAGWNLTKQGQLYQSDQQEAERLMKSVGVKLGATVPNK